MFGKLSLGIRWLGTCAVLLFSQLAAASPIAIGYMSFDVTSGTTAQFDVANLTGTNALAPDFPVLTPLAFTSLNLLVTFSDGSTHAFGLADFTLSADGMSLDGPTVAIGGTTLPVAATLSGLVNPASIDPGTGTMMDIDAAFTPVTLGDANGPALDDGTLGILYVHEPRTGSVPEPSSAWLVLIGAAAFGLRRRGRWAVAAALLAAAGGASATTSVKLAAASIPSSGVVGVSYLKVTAMGLPAVAPSGVMVTIAPTCAVGGPVAGQVVTPASAIIPVIGSTSQVRFQIPAALGQGTYYVSLSGGSGAGAFASSTCAVMNATTTNTTLNSCLPTSSLAVALGPTVTAYVPNGWWGGGATGVQVVPIEGPGAPTSIPTAGIVNSCSANPSTGQAVCTANTNDVYLINGHTLTNTLASGATMGASFSGGTCRNCGVAVNGLTNTAYITVGLSDSPSGSGIQALNLGTNAFGAPLRLKHIVSENISVDAGRNLLLTPGEDNNYGLVRLSGTGGLLAEYENTAIGGGGEYDSSAADCTTGIALASNEFTSNVSMADLNQASFTPGSGSAIGTWTAPASVVTLDGSFAAGISGISVAPGGQHMGILTGEFGGQSFAVFQLPATPGTGGTPPALVDYAVVNNLPNTPDGAYFAAGYDPHTITAYTSPNDGRAYAVIADWATGTPSWLAVIDLKKIQGAPRVPGTHTVDTSVYDVLASGAVRYVPVH